MKLFTTIKFRLIITLFLYAVATFGESYSYGGLEDISSYFKMTSKDGTLPAVSSLPLSMTYQDPFPNATDNSIDEDGYFVGGGDQFVISFLDQASMVYDGTVNPSGDLYIPSLGLIRLGKITLSQAKQTIIETLQSRTSKKRNIYVSLNQAKKATIYLNGITQNPCRYILPGTMRIADAVRASFGNMPPNFAELNLREIGVATTDTVIYYDMLKYLATGDKTQNPYVYPGDIITLSNTTRRVMVNGPVKCPLTKDIPIIENESLEHFLSLFLFDDSADTTYILLKHFDEQNRERVTIVPAAEYSSWNLHDHCIITIPERPNYPAMAVVTVKGEVERPGDYPIIKDSTTVKDVLSLAGLLPSASLSRIAVVRYNKLVKNNANADRTNLLTSLESTFTRTEMNNAIMLMMLSKDYIVLHASDTSQTLLEQGDHLLVAKNDHTVYVSGAVKQPGGYQFVENKNMRYYIRQAGGWSSLADKQNVYKMVLFNNDVMQFSEVGTVCEGDMIVVPFSKENKMLTNIFLPVFQVVATSITLLVAVLSIDWN